MRSLLRVTAHGLVWVSLSGLTGCATTAELEALRAEVEQANETAAHAAAEAARTRRELADLKATAREEPEHSIEEVRPAGPPKKKPSYKWGELNP